MKSCAWARLAAASICSWRGVGPGVGDVAGDRVGEQEAVVGHERDLGPQRGQIHVLDVGPVDHDAALARVIEPREQPDQARLAGGGGPDQRDGPAWLDLQVDARQRGLGTVIAQRHSLQRDLSAALRQRRRAGRALHRGLAIEDLEHPVAGGDGALGHAQRHPEPAHGSGEHHDVEVEGGQMADAGVAVDDLKAAHQEHGREPEVRQEAHQRRVERLQAGRDHALLEDAVRPSA